MEFQKQNIIDFINIALQTTPGEGCGEQTIAVNKLPRSFNGLDVTYSVGKGRATSIPWITFTGYEQKVTDGIYPVILYYHERNFLVVAFGVSATNEPTEKWNIPGLKTLDQYFTEQYINQTNVEKKYNASFVHSVFPVPVIGGKVDESKFNIKAVFSSQIDVCDMYKKQFEGKKIATTAPEAMSTIETAVKIVDKSKKNVNYWIYAPGDKACKWSTCQRLGYMSLGWEEMGTLSLYKDRNSIVQNLRVVYNNDNASFKNASLALWQFVHDIKVGDIIYVKKGRSLIVGRGIVTGDYKYDETLDDYNNTRSVNWTHSGEWDAPCGLPMKTLTRINDYTEMVERLERLFDPEVTVEQFPFSISPLISAIKRTGLLYEDKLIQRYACSLMTKPFVILSGLAGSGKTQLALTFARAMSENVEQQLCAVPVGADWTNREPLLGYPNALKQGEYMQPESGALQIMMRALRNPQKPYFLVLDEMNLSYVERYFADFLSALESNQKIPLWEKPDECDSEVDASIALPKNLFIVGTINVDETTYMFSPKVLDRANVIEFKISDTEMEQFLGQDMSIDVNAADGACANMGQDFVQKATSKETDNSELAQRTLLEFFKVLKKVNAEFGYRSATEIYRFIANAKACANGMTENEILDAAIVQKLLPKLHGSRKKLEPALKALWGLCMTDDHKTEAITRENAEQYAKFAEAADKIQRMMQTALDNGFTSFAEA